MGVGGGAFETGGFAGGLVASSTSVSESLDAASSSHDSATTFLELLSSLAGWTFGLSGCRDIF